MERRPEVGGTTWLQGERVTARAEKILVPIGFATVCFVWGSTWLAIKIGLGSVPPLLAVGVRFMLASGILYAIIRFRKLNIEKGPEAYKLYAALVLLSYSIPFGLVYWGMQFIPSSLSSILFAALPLWVVLFSHFILPDEHISLLKIVGILLGIGGVYVIFSGELEWKGMEGLPGMLAIIVSTIMQGITLVLVKRYGQTQHPVSMNFVGMIAGGVILLAASFLLEPVETARWDAAAIGSIAYLALVGSVVVFVTYYWLLKRMEAVVLSLTSFVTPIVAVILGALILDESLSPNTFLGGTLVLIGIFVANGKIFYKKYSRVYNN